MARTDDPFTNLRKAMKKLDRAQANLTWGQWHDLAEEVRHVRERCMVAVDAMGRGRDL